MAITPAYQASGIASGLDTTSIVNSLVAIETQPITALQTTQTALKSQVSQLGTLASQLSALGAAASALSTGVVQVSVSSSNTGFTATADSTATAGNYNVQVTSLAAASKARSQGFASATAAAVAGGNLHLDVQGTGYDVAIAEGSDLTAVANSINASGAPVVASVISDGTQSYLSVTNNNSGFTPGTDPTAALGFTFTPTGGSSNASLAFASVQTAANAALTVDNLPVVSQSNDVSDVIPGVTLQLKSLTSAPEVLSLATDQTKTAANLQSFITAYNTVVSDLESQLNVAAGADRSSTLAGDSTVRSLQQSLQALFTTSVPGLSGISTLADLGLTTAEDGSLSLDTSKLNAALALNPNAVNQVFSTATTGLSATTQALVTQYTDPISGALTLDQQGLTSRSTDIDSEVLQMQARVDSFRANLVAQFTAMETIVSSFKSTGDYLTALANAQNPSK
jgi:flagellar hook-associated protein 2